MNAVTIDPEGWAAVGEALLPEAVKLRRFLFLVVDSGRAPSGGLTQFAPVSWLQNGGLSCAPWASIAGRSVSNAIVE